MLRRLRFTPVLLVLLLTSAVPATTACSDTATGPGNSQCCKVCTTGKACGNSCIAKNKNCTKGAGCACNG